MLGGGYLTPVSLLDDIYNWDKYYYVWVAVQDTLNALPDQTKRILYGYLHLRKGAFSSYILTCAFWIFAWPEFLFGVVRALHHLLIS